MSEPLYGRFDEDEYKRRGGDRHLIQNGKHYRIAEFAPQIDGSVRYQAWEVDMPLAEPVVESPPEPVAVATPARPVVEDPPLPPIRDFKPIRPTLSVWALTHGWKGRGPIPRSVKNMYHAEFDVED